MENKAFLQFELCGRKRTIETNPVELRPFEIRFEKFADCRHVIPGESTEFRIKIQNQSDVNLRNVEFCDPLHHGLEYVQNTFRVNGRHHHPTIHRNRIEFVIECLHANTELEISFNVRMKRHEHCRPSRPARIIRI